MTTIRVGRRDRYTVIDRGALNDRRLSFRARGILAYLLDKPDDWATNVDGVASAGREGREAVATALRELEDAGYLVRKRWRNLAGRWESEWTVYERPDANALLGAKAGNRRRVTRSGQPLRFPGAQLPKTETENGPSQGSFFAADDPTDPAVAPPWLDEGMTREEWLQQGRAGRAG